MRTSVACIAMVLMASAVLAPAAAARGGQRGLLELGKGTHFLVGIMDHFSKSHHDSYSNPTIIAAQPTVVYAPMPQLEPVQTLVSPTAQEPPAPVKTKSASITFGDKFGKSATITFTKTIPDPSKVLEKLGLDKLGLDKLGLDKEEPAPAPTPIPVPNPTPVPIPNPVPVPIPTPVPVQPLPQSIIASQPQLQYVVAPGQQQVQFVAAQQPQQFVAAQPQQYVASQPQQVQFVAAQPQQVLPGQPQQMAYAGSYVAAQPQAMPTYVQPAAPVAMPTHSTWGKK